MTSLILSSTSSRSWDISLAGNLSGIILAGLFIYLFFRHFLLFLMFMDIILGWLRKFSWFPTEGKRMKTFVHWIVALGLFVGFLVLAGSVGWLQFVPQ